jgi:hypothetical protein
VNFAVDTALHIDLSQIPSSQRYWLAAPVAGESASRSGNLYRSLEEVNPATQIRANCI